MPQRPGPATPQGRPLALPNPSDELLLEMMSVTLGETIPAEYAAIIRHELQLAPRAEARGQ